ncbi:hypothetical protein H1R20_g10125, partial [Candolleomyces eurysporus]
MDLEASDLSHLLINNDPPNAFQRTCLKQGAEALIKEIEDLRRSNALDPALEDLKCRLRQHKILLSPWRRIPLELISEILSHVELRPVLRWLERKELKWLCLVCKNWWHAAKLTHKFWSGLSFCFDPKDNLRWNLVADWFRRSGSAPRTLQLQIMSHSYSNCDKAKNCLLASSGLPELLAQGPALTRFSIRAADARCVQSLLHAIEARKPKSKRCPWDSVTSLSISDSAGKWGEDASKFLSKGIPPTLTTLALFLPSYPSDGAIPTFQVPKGPLSNLTTFHLQCHNWPRSFVIATLRNCPNVETLTLDLAGNLWECDGTTTSRNLSRAGIRLSNLKTLRLLHVHPDAATILSALKVQVVSHLEVSFMPFQSYSDFDWESDSEDPDFNYHFVDQTFSKSLWKFLQDGRQNTLQYLRIHACLIQCEVFDKIWRIESLRHLCLDDAVYDYDRKEFPELWKMVPRPVPNLEILELNDYQSEFIDLDGIEEVIRKRLDPPINLIFGHKRHDHCCC